MSGGAPDAMAPEREAVRPAAPATDAIALGPPSVLATWVFDLLRSASALAPEPPEVRVIDREHAVEPEGDRPRCLYLCHFPSPSLRAEWGRNAAPILLCLDDPVDSVRFVQQASGGGVFEALRAQTVAAASYAELRGHPRVLILHRLAEASAAVIVDTLVDHFGLGLDAAQLAVLRLKHLPEGQPDAALEAALQARVAGYAPLGQSELEAKEVATIGGVLSPLLQLSFRDVPGPIVWPVEAFFSGDKPNTPAPPVAELTGGARILYYGPYFYLPPGAWKIRLMVGFSVDARSLPFSVEVCAGEHVLAIATMKGEHGVYHATFGFVHDDPLQAVEVRVRTDRGAIEGRLALGNVEFTRETATTAAN